MADGKEDCTRLPLKRRRNQILNLSVSDLIDEDILLSDSGSEYHPESDCTDTSCENNEEVSYTLLCCKMYVVYHVLLS